MKSNVVAINDTFERLAQMLTRPNPTLSTIVDAVDMLGDLEHRIEPALQQIQFIRDHLRPVAERNGAKTLRGRRWEIAVGEGQAADKIDRERLYEIVPRSRLKRRGIVQDGAPYITMTVKPKAQEV